MLTDCSSPPPRVLGDEARYKLSVRSLGAALPGRNAPERHRQRPTLRTRVGFLPPSRWLGGELRSVRPVRTQALVAQPGSWLCAVVGRGSRAAERGIRCQRAYRPLTSF